jgi:hypothetical protein
MSSSRLANPLRPLNADPAGRFGLDTARASHLLETRFFHPRKARGTPSAAQEENRNDMGHLAHHSAGEPIM